MTRHEQRYKAMTILYQAFLYDNNNISYDINSITNEMDPMEISDRLNELFN